MKKIVLLFLVLFLTIFLVAEEDFDTFDDEETSFVIKTKKPKIMVKKDSTEEKEAVKFSKTATQSNKAVEISVKNFLILSKLKEIDARYLVLELSLKNILKSQKVIVSKGSNHPANWVNKSSDDFEYKEMVPRYQIPDVMQHLYLRVNNEQEKPIDIMSLLVDRPLIDFNTNTVEVLPEKLKEGQLAFRLAKGKKIEQLSLHYYDTKYGNINLPIIGEMKAKTVDVTTLPKTAWQKMNDNFSLSVTGYDIKDKIRDNQAKKDGQFEIVEIDIESKVYALLEFQPKERFYLKIGDTHRLKLHPITQALPMGLYSSASLSPGSNNKFRLAFYVPKGMEKQSRSLMVELKGKDIVIPIKKGDSGNGSKVLAKGIVEGTSVEVNGVYLYDDKILVDMTFDDKDDSFSTRLSRAFYLSNKPSSNLGSRKTVRDVDEDDIQQTSGMGSFTNNRYKSIYPWYYSLDPDNTILGLKKKIVVLNGNKKRVFLWFDNQFNKKYTKPWYVVSDIFKDLKYKIGKEPKPLPKNLKYFLAKNYPYTHKEDSIDRKVLAMVERFKAQKAKEVTKDKKRKQQVAKLEDKNRSDFITIPAMSASVYGEERVAKLKTVDDLIKGLKTLDWIPSGYEATTAIYSTSAIFTQGWTTENEMFKAIYNKVKDNGVKFGSYLLSNNGKKELKKLAKNIPLAKRVPFIEWEKEGKKHSLVLPFLKPIEEVKKYVSDKKYLKDIKEKQATIEMTLTYNPKQDGSATSSFSMFGSALGGGTTSEKTDVIFKKSWNLDEISDTPIDVYFPATTAFYTDNNGTHQDSANALSAKKVEPKVLTVQITMPDGKLDTYEHYFKDKQKLKDVFFTFALGTPDMPKVVIEEMEDKRKKLFKYKDMNKLSGTSGLKWENRIKTYKFVAMQTKYENSLSKDFNIQAKRNKNPRVIVSMVEHFHNNKIISSLDLRYIFNNVYGDTNSTNAFNIMSGIYNSEAEGKAANQGESVSTIWKRKKDLQIILLPNIEKDETIKWMKENNISKNIILRYTKSENYWLFPINITKDIGWFEVNPNNYQTISVLESNKYGGEYTALLKKVEENGWYVGVMTGASHGFLIHNTVALFGLEEGTCKIAALIASGLSLFSSMSINPSLIDKIMTGAAGANSTLGTGGLAASTALRIYSHLTFEKKPFAGFMAGYNDGLTLYFLAQQASGNCK